MLYFRVPFASYDYIVLSPDLAAIVTVLTVVVLANAMNLIDGLDGLATGIVIIAGTALFLYSDRLFKAGLLDGSNIGPLVAVIAVSICAGFLPHNFNPARIFMGDAGAMFLGLLLGVTTITVGGRTADQFSGQTYFFFAPLLIPVVILAVPLIDTAVLPAAPSRSPAVGLDRRPGAPAPPAHAPRARPAARRASSCGSGPRWPPPPRSSRRSPTGATPSCRWRSARLALLLFTYFHPGLRTREEPATEPPAAPAAPDAGDLVDLEERRRRRSG